MLYHNGHIHVGNFFWPVSSHPNQILAFFSRSRTEESAFSDVVPTWSCSPPPSYTDLASEKISIPQTCQSTRNQHALSIHGPLLDISKESHCLQVEFSTTVGLKTIWRPGACSYCRSSVVHLGLNDWWTTWQRLTASLIAAISHATANGGLNVTSLFKGPRQQTETNLKTTTRNKYISRLFKPKSTIYWRHRACRFSTQLLLWL